MTKELFYKLFNIKRYNHLKEKQRKEHQLAQISRFADQSPIFLGQYSDAKNQTPGNTGQQYIFKHSGHIGDVIYSLPSAIALAENRSFTFNLRTNTPLLNAKNCNHPTGNVLLTKQVAENLAELLRTQPYIDNCLIDDNPPFNIDLDIFRSMPIDLKCGNIAKWHALIFPISHDLSKPWIYVDPIKGLEDHIIVARSSRYNNPLFDYSFLNKIKKKLLFVGLPQEFEALRKVIPKLEHHQTPNFLELARTIKGGRFFIGNQSSPFAIAEALKVRRVLEVYPWVPNVIPEGHGSYQALFQPQFEMIVSKLLDETKLSCRHLL